MIDCEETSCGSSVQCVPLSKLSISAKTYCNESSVLIWRTSVRKRPAYSLPY